MPSACSALRVVSRPHPPSPRTLSPTAPLPRHWTWRWRRAWPGLPVLRSASAFLPRGALSGSRPENAAAIRVAGAITLLQGIPPVHDGLRRLLGPGAAEIALSLPKIAVLTFAGSPLGLVVAGAEALHLYTALREQKSGRERHEQRAETTAPGAEIRIGAGERIPLAATVLEGTGTAIGGDALPVAAFPGATLPAGARFHGGPFLLELHEAEAHHAKARPAPPAPSFYDRYLQAISPLGLACAGATAVATRSFDRTFASLLLVNSRAAMIGGDAAAAGATARVSRAGGVLLSRHPDRSIRLPDFLFLDGPRVLTDGLELVGAVPLGEGTESAEVLARAAGVSAAAGRPWGPIFRAADVTPAAEARFDGHTASAEIDGIRFSLAPADDAELPSAVRMEHRGRFLLLLRREEDAEQLAILVFRPRLAPGAEGLIKACRRHGIEVVPGDGGAGGDPSVARMLAERVGISLAEDDPVSWIRKRQYEGKRVGFVSDSVDAGAAFAACDMGIAIGDGRFAFPASTAPADLLAPNLETIGVILEAAVQHEKARHDAAALSLAANVAGAGWGFRAQPELAQASRLVDGAALTALAAGRVRLRGGGSAEAAAVRIEDPRPERWGEHEVKEVLRTFETTEAGLTDAVAEQRRRAVPTIAKQHPFLEAVVGNFRSPLTAIVGGATGLALLAGHRADAVVMALTLAGNVLVGAWQEYRVGEVATALGRMGTATGRVLRDGQPVTVPAREIVPGDVLLLAPGDRLAADARVIDAQGLEVDEAALTGESLPVRKTPHGGTPAHRILLEGSDVIVGHGRAVVVAVGAETRMGATAAALAAGDDWESPLSTRLSQLFRQVLPVTAAAGAIVTAGGLIRGKPLLPELVAGSSVALAALPEALPILAGMGQAAAARRLARHNALVRRPSAVEALGRVDVACVDKTGTLTEGRLALRLVASCGDREADLQEEPGELTGELRRVLLTAALASPHPDAGDAASHSTDVAVMRGAAEAGLTEEMRARRQREARFDSARPFHAALVRQRLRVKGAPEALVGRCAAVAGPDGDRPLDDAGREELLARAQRLAERGLRVIMVAEGPVDASPDDPQELVALGFLGISDPLRPTVPAALERCHEAGIRVIMLTGDHPATARAIAREAGLLDGGEILTGVELAQLQDAELDPLLERVAVIARATPLDTSYASSKACAGGDTPSP